MQKFTITAAEIDGLMRVFYARIRTHDTLGPVFLKAIGTEDEAWRDHEAKIASFWRNACGLDRSYSGNPMMVHVSNHDIQPHHFALWLALFRDTAKEVLPTASADGIAALADRIGASLSMGMAQVRQRMDAPPPLGAAR